MGNQVKVVRIYLTESEEIKDTLFSILHDEFKVAGVTLFRGISGFGGSGKVHTSHLLDLSLDLPVVVEFFDSPDVIDPILEKLNTIIEPGHILIWMADVNP